MKILNSLARIVFAIPFLFFGIGHLSMAKNMSAMVPSYIPGGIFWIYFTGACMILAAVSFIINRMTKLSGILIALMLLIFILTIHLPGLQNEAMKQMAMMSMFKDLGLLAGSLMIVANSK